MTWGVHRFEYEHLAGCLRDALRRDPHAFDADRLAVISEVCECLCACVLHVCVGAG